ncbi:TPA: hypothetical protein M2P43_001598 [Klebsiella variicola]|uniref:hypothetical protein n=1 Tax=Klebsiella variicola TaxID=244366 RepID=UPI001AD6DEDC|nr:hypothetical protein [Klebsiella variicola]QTI08914.1 hypothetical protein JJB14_14460 [Klebsiella variicola]HDK6151940.1 hypothetical protein [Klebsiella variicola]
MMIPAGPDNKKARKKAGNKHEGNSNVGDDRKYPGWVWRPATLLQQRPLMDWIMSPSSGQAIILCWLNQQSGSDRRHKKAPAGCRG